MSQQALDEFWEMATSEMLSVLRHHCLHCQDNYLLLKIKQSIVWFCHTVMGHGFNNDKLYEVALEIREHYDELLMKTNADAFKNLLVTDDYTPVIVETDQHFQGIMEMFNYKDLQIHHEPLPKKLPFSSMVIQIYEQVSGCI
uniref:Exocyst complex subunit EXOC6/Sec15 C-terminal domain-containing protein n=1 Tax=Amphimedon queenslandica TaxID=400682 RepID=A0A1X7V9I3_AMPQE